MNIKTKYNLCDFVYPITKRTKKIFTTCGFCNGEGYIIGINKEEHSCPMCHYAGGFYEMIGDIWVVYCERASKIGQIQTVTQKNKKEVNYMIEATGIGSGTNWYECYLFLTEAEAQAECDRLNKLEDKK